MKDSLVSIITPAYNAEEYIAETIESVLNQTYQNWEMIVVNDCSKDSTVEIIQGYIKSDSRINLINLKKNSGVAVARNEAIKNAKGRYIAFLDSDDIWKKEKLQKQIEFMQKNSYVFTFTGYQQFKSDRTEVGRVVKIPTVVNYNQALKGNPIGCLTVMLDKEKIKDIEFCSAKHEDYRLWLKILKQGIQAFGINETLAYYRIGNGKSISGNKFKSAIWTWKVYREDQKLSFVKSIYCMSFYIARALNKII